MNPILHLIKTATKTNPKQKFNKVLSKQLQAYGLEAAKTSQEEVINYLQSINGKLKDKNINKAMSIIDEAYLVGLDDIESSLLKQRELLTKHYKRRLPIAKANWHKEGGLVYKADDTLSYDLNLADERAIKLLTEADIVFIMKHPPKSEIAKAINNLMIAGRVDKLLGNQIANLLREEFAKYTPEKYAEKFGEMDYWVNVVREYDTMTKSTTTLNDFNEAGYVDYRWYARMTERTCKTCKRLHNRVFTLSAAMEDLEKYYAAAERGDYEELKAIGGWLKSPEEAAALSSGSGYFPSAHWKCECWIRMNLGYDYK
jgi:hypothetical protein